MNDSIFTKIIKGEIPSHKVYEDEYTYAFLDIHPVTPGHTMVIPKKQVEFVWDLEDVDYQRVMATARLVAKHMKEVLGVPYVGMKIVGTDVPHAHVHLIPFTSSDEFHRHVDMAVAPDHVDLALMAERLSF